MIGATLGVLLGFLFAGPLGLIIGPFVGALSLELLAGRSAGQSLRSGLGTAIGILAGKVTELAVGIGLTASVISVLASQPLGGRA